MVEKRKARRLIDNNEIMITVFADGKTFPKEQIVYNHSQDISVLGVRIKTDVYLPINSFIRTEMKLKSIHPLVTTIGKIKWIKAILGKNSYEAGVEFFDPTSSDNQPLQDYISWLGSLPQHNAQI